MRVRKKPDLRLDIPSYPHDYVEMPVETKRLILEANRTSNDIQFVDDDASSTKQNEELNNDNVTRSRTPEVKITSAEDITTDVKDRDIVQNDVKEDGVASVSAESPVVYRKPLKRGSISVPHGLKIFDGTNVNKDSLNVSLLFLEQVWQLAIATDSII